MHIGRAATRLENRPIPASVTKLVATSSGVALLTMWVTVRTVLEMTLGRVACSMTPATACRPAMFNVREVL